MKLLDASVIICIYTEIKCPEILKHWRDQGYTINICKFVHNEIQNNSDTYEKVRPDISNNLIKCIQEVNTEEIEQFKNRHPNLGLGEIETIITGIKLKKLGKRNYCVIDDGLARKIAKKYGISLTGTYGLTKRLREKNVLNVSQYNLILEKLRGSKFRISFDKLC